MYQPHKKPFQFWLVHSCHRRLTWIELRRRRGTNALRDIKLNRVCSCIAHTHYMYLPIGLKSKNQCFHDKFALIRKLCWQYYIYFSLPNIISTKKRLICYDMIWQLFFSLGIYMNCTNINFQYYCINSFFSAFPEKIWGGGFQNKNSIFYTLFSLRSPYTHTYRQIMS